MDNHTSWPVWIWARLKLCSYFFVWLEFKGTVFCHLARVRTSTSCNWGNDLEMKLFSSSLGPRLDHIQMIWKRKKYLCCLCSVPPYELLWAIDEQMEHILVLLNGSFLFEWTYPWKLLVDFIIISTTRHWQPLLNFKTVSIPRFQKTLCLCPSKKSIRLACITLQVLHL